MCRMWASQFSHRKCSWCTLSVNRILSRIRPKYLGTQKWQTIIAPDEWIDKFKDGGGVFLLCRLLARFVRLRFAALFHYYIFPLIIFASRISALWHLKKRSKNSYCLRLNGSAFGWMETILYLYFSDWFQRKTNLHKSHASPQTSGGEKSRKS